MHSYIPVIFLLTNLSFTFVFKGRDWLLWQMLKLPFKKCFKLLIFKCGEIF